MFDFAYKKINFRALSLLLRGRCEFGWAMKDKRDGPNVRSKAEDILAGVPKRAAFRSPFLTPGLEQGAISAALFLVPRTKFSLGVPKKDCESSPFSKMVYPTGFEPVTLRVGVSCSIQLGYGYNLSVCFGYYTALCFVLLTRAQSTSSIANTSRLV